MKLILILTMQFIVICQTVKLKKPKTIVLPMLINMGGSIAPMGDLCNITIDMFLDAFNNQFEYLPYYNLVAEMTDDGCSPVTAVKNMIPQFLNWQSRHDFSETGSGSGKTYIPQEIEFEQATAVNAIRVPFFGGPICSGACKAIGKYPQFFDLIEVSHACVDPTMDDRNLYKNYYRQYRSSTEYSDVRIALAKHMNWSKIAIISDTSQYTYSDSTYFMKYATDNNITITAEAFFSDEPSSAVGLLKNVDARIIFSICYINTCPMVACEAYRQGFYGPNVVWIFNSDVNLASASLQRPPGCTKAMTDEFAQYTLFVGVDITGAVFKYQHRGQIGHSAADVTEHLKTVDPATAGKGNFGWRLLCYEMVQHVAFIVSDVEKELQKQGETLSDIVGSASRADELEERFRSGVLNMKINATWGQSQQSSGSTPSLYRHTSPFPTVEQTRPDLSRQLVFWLTEKGELAKMPSVEPEWKTASGKPPRSEILIEIRRLKVSKVVLIIQQIIALILLSGICLTAVILFKDGQCEGLKDSFKRMTLALLIGCCLPLLAILVYPHDGSDMGTFCKLAPSFLAISLIIVYGSLSIKILMKFICYHNYNGSVVLYGKTKNYFSVIFLLAVAAIVAIVIASGAGSNALQPQTIQSTETPDTSMKEKALFYQYEICHSENFILGWVVVIVVIFVAILGILASVAVKNRTKGLYMSDGKLSSLLLYLLFPIMLIHILAVATLTGDLVQLEVYTAFAYLQSLIVTASFWWWKIKALFDAKIELRSSRFDHNILIKLK